MNDTELPSGVVKLPQLGLIRAEGPEAAHFLHNQLTQDFLLIKPNQARLAGYCSAKGRLLASFVGWKADEQTVLLVLPQALVAPMVKRLSLFVLRAKVKLSDASADFDLFGLIGSCADQALGETASAPWSRARQGDADVIRWYPAFGQSLALWLAPKGQKAPSGPTLALSDWQWAEVNSAVVLLPALLTDALVPQMGNYESVGGVNFKKGCYPGQEVVARSQFRGTLKRRGFLLRTGAAAQPGQELFHSGDATQPCGVVVSVASAPEGYTLVFASLQIAATQSGQLHCATPDGPLLDVLPLPYPLLEDI